MLKSLKYYQNTVNLKLTAAICKIKYEWLEMPHSGKILSRWISLPEPQLIPAPYLSYGFFNETTQQERIMQTNENGVYIAPDYGTHKGVECPIYPAHFALLTSDQLLQSGLVDELKTNRLQAHLNYLQNISSQTIHGTALLNHYDLPDYECKSGWINGLTQSLAASAFIRGGFIFEEKATHFELAKSLLNQMLTPAEMGGSSILINSSLLWIEEYPGKTHSLVLNGFIGGIIGLLDYRNSTGDLSFDQEIERTIKTLFHELPSFIYGKNIRYCKKHFRFSNLMYQGLYVFQMLHLYELTKNETFLDLARRFNTLNWDGFCRFYEIPSKDKIMKILRYYQL